MKSWAAGFFAGRLRPARHSHHCRCARPRPRRLFMGQAGAHQLVHVSFDVVWLVVAAGSEVALFHT